MFIRTLMCCEYENGYDPVYGGIYDQNFVFYDDEDLEEESFDDYGEDEDNDNDGDEIGELDYEENDVVLDEISSIYCPSRGETGEA